MKTESYPSYHLSAAVLARLAWAVVLRQQRSFRADAGCMVRGIAPPLEVNGRENIPLNGPGVITINHYTRTGFTSLWLGLTVSAAVPADIYWTVASTWTFPGKRLGKVYRFLSQCLFREVFQVYGFNPMPPMPPAPEEAVERAAAVRRIIQYARENSRALVGLAPEGGDQPGGVLRQPPEGSGRLALALARLGMPFYPVGLFEAEGRLNLNFGKPYCLNVDSPFDRASADAAASDQLMCAIAACLPERLRGDWA